MHYFCIGDSVPPPSNKSLLLTKIMKIILIIEIGFSIVKFFFSIWFGILDLICAFFLFMSFRQFSYSYCEVYIFICFYLIFQIFVELGLKIQHNQKILMNYDMIVKIIGVFLYVISIIVVFSAYKEFKGISLDIIYATFSDNGYSMGNYPQVNEKNEKDLKNSIFLIKGYMI